MHVSPEHLEGVKMKVADVMTRRVRSCQPASTLEAVARIMWEQDLGALPVTDDTGRPIAMITDRDLAVAAYTQGKALRDVAARTAMSRELHTVHVSDNLEEAERIMRRQQIRRLAVVDESARLVGMLTLNDIARSRTRAFEGPDAITQLAEVGKTLATISRPRSPAASEPASSRAPAAEELSRDRTASPGALRGASSNARRADHSDQSGVVRRYQP
jgi:CBS domain-containing protein